MSQTVRISRHRIVRRLSFSLAICLAIWPSFCIAQAPSAKVVPPPPKPFVLPAYSKMVMPNGLTILMLEKHEVPLISVNITLRSGSVADPTGKEGLAVLTEQLLRKGTTTRTAAQFAEDTDFIGMQLGGGGVTLDASGISSDFLKKDQATALSLISDMVLHPVFPQSEFDKALSRAQDSVRSSKDSAQAVIGRYYAKFLYGSNPYGRPVAGDETSLASIHRDDVLSFYKTNYTPANAVLAVAGDFDATAMKAALQAAFGAWSGKAPIQPPLPKMTPVKGRKLLLVDKPDATQTYFVMGNIGLNATSPDRGTVSVVNDLYGGRFTSLFNTELRIKSGFSYGASSSFSQLREPGPFTMSTYTRNEKTGPAIDKSIEVVDTAHAQGFTAEQLTSAKNLIAGSLPPSLETVQALANLMARNELYSITRDQFNANLVSAQSTTVPDARRVLDIYFPTSANLVIVVIGKASEIEPLIKKYTADITVKKIGDPGY